MMRKNCFPVTGSRRQHLLDRRGDRALLVVAQRLAGIRERWRDERVVDLNALAVLDPWAAHCFASAQALSELVRGRELLETLLGPGEEIVLDDPVAVTRVGEAHIEVDGIGHRLLQAGAGGVDLVLRLDDSEGETAGLIAQDIVDLLFSVTRCVLADQPDPPSLVEILTFDQRLPVSGGEKRIDEDGSGIGLIHAHERPILPRSVACDMGYAPTMITAVTAVPGLAPGSWCRIRRADYAA